MNQANYAEQKINKSFCSIVIDEKLVELIPERMDYTGEMNGGILSLQIHQIYKNDKGDDKSPDRKAVLVLPKARTQCITGIDCLLNKQKIDLKIEEEKAAESIAKEGEKQGKTTIRSVTTSDEQFLNIHLGSISFGSEIDITIHMEILSTNSDSNTYQTLIPFSEQALDTTDPSKFTFSIVINEIENITDIDITCSYERSDFEFTFDGSVLTIDKKPIGPIVLLIKLEKEIPSLIHNDLHDEYSVISVIPHFLSKPVNSDFIFIVDCSGSMSGSRIRNASECLSTFLHSLPVGCKFNIILFGTRYESVFGYEGLVEYNEANLQRAENAVNNLKANMGGTNLLGPLETAYEQCESKSKKGNVVQIFLLTDGEIHDTETVFKLVSKNRAKSRIFSIGIGKDADRNLVSGLAVLSYGKFDFVSESSQITDKVIGLLSLSLAPALTNVSIHASENDEIEVVPNPLTPIYDGNLMSIFVKRSSKENKIDHVLITGNIGDEETEIVIDESCNICESSAKKLFAFNAINDYEKMYNDLSEKDSNSRRFRNRKPRNSDDENNELKKLKDKIVTLSVENGIISKFTSFIGVEKEPHKLVQSSDDSDYDMKEEGEPMICESVASRRRAAPRMMFGAAPKKRIHKSQAKRAMPMKKAKAKSKAISSSSSSDNDDILFDAAPPKYDYTSFTKAAPHHLEQEFAGHSFMQYESSSMKCEAAAPHIKFNAAAPHIKFNAAAPPQIERFAAAPLMKCEAAAPRSFSSDMDDEETGDKEAELFSSSNQLFGRSFEDNISQDDLDNPQLSFAFASSASNSESPKIEKNLSGLIKAQDFDGKWKSQLISSLFEFFNNQADEAKKSIEASFETLGVKDDEEGKCIRSTVVALCVLHKMFEKEQSRWKLIENKALNWLKSKMKSTEWQNEIQKLLSAF